MPTILAGKCVLIQFQCLKHPANSCVTQGDRKLETSRSRLGMAQRMRRKEEQASSLYWKAVDFSQHFLPYEIFKDCLRRANLATQIIRIRSEVQYQDGGTSCSCLSRAVSHLNVLEPVSDALRLPQQHLSVFGERDAQREVTLLVDQLHFLDLQKTKKIGYDIQPGIQPSAKR